MIDGKIESTIIGMDEFDFIGEFEKSKAASPPSPPDKLWYIIILMVIVSIFGVTVNILAIWGVIVLLKSWGAL